MPANELRFLDVGRRCLICILILGSLSGSCLNLFYFIYFELIESTKMKRCASLALTIVSIRLKVRSRDLFLSDPIIGSYEHT